MRTYTDLAGKKFHKLLVIKVSGKARNGMVKWLCQCDCGNETSYTYDHLTRKNNPVKSCGCHRKKMKGPNHPQWTGYGEISGGWWQSHVLREYSKNGHKRPKVAVTITIEEAWNLFLQQGRKCALSGIPIFIETTEGTTASLDRIDSSRGYELGNVQWTHKHINFMKYTHEQNYFIEMCKKVAQHNG